jgi:hypothetical protein
MDERDKFFSPGHERLLGIAVWAKYLAWVVLAFHILISAIQPFMIHGDYQHMQALADPFERPGFQEMIGEDPLFYLVKIGSGMIRVFLNGLIYYLVLKGISLGLNMIVETDVNYRERHRQGGAS